MYLYDSYGRLLHQATDTNNNGSIDLGSDHNVLEYFGHYQKFGSDWYDFNGYGIYGTDGSSTMKSLEANYKKVSAFSVNTGSDSTIAYQFTQNKYGDFTEDFTKSRRSQAKLIHQHYIDQNPSADLLVSQSVNINGLDVEVLNTEGHLFSKHYDPIGRLELDIDGRDLETEYGYDSKGQLSWVEDSAGVRTTYYYDSSTGLMFKETKDGKEALYGHNLKGQVTHTYGATPYPVRYEYNDPLGRMTKMETFREGDFDTLDGFDGTSDQTTWTYDSHSGLLKKKTDDKGKYSEYTYNALGQTLTRRDGRGVIVTNQYYAAVNPGTGGFPNALKKVVYPSAGGYNNTSNAHYTPDILYTYKRHGAIYEVTEGSTAGPANKRNKRVFSYDSNFDLTREDLGVYTNDIYHQTNDVINYTYETSTYGFKGRLKSFNFRNDSTYKNSFTYDGTSRLDKVTANHFSATAFDYSYHDDANVVDSMQFGNYQQELTYRSDSYRLDKIRHLWGSDSGKTQETRLEYDTSSGLRTYEKMKGTVVTTLGRPSAGYAAKVEYDDRNQVKKFERYNINATTWAATTAISNTKCDWVFDNQGNKDYETIAPASLAQYTANELNQYTAIPGASPTYDDNGNMLTDGTRTMVYDAENRLVRVSIGANNWTYQYDYLDRRITLSKNGSLQKKFVYHGWNLIAETNSGDTVGRKFTWGLDVSSTSQGAGGVGGLLMIQDGSAEYYPIYDGSRNIVGLYNESGGIAAAYEYDAYGRITLQSGSYAASNPFRFSTKYTDEDTYLVYYGYRFYNPGIGCFINRDPIGESGGVNLYGLAGNNPVNGYDYLGLCTRPSPSDYHWRFEPDTDDYDTWEDKYDDAERDYDICLADARWKAEVDASIQGGSPSEYYDEALQWAATRKERRLLLDQLAQSNQGTQNGSPLGNSLRKFPILGLILGPVGDVVSGLGNFVTGDFRNAAHELGYAIYYPINRLVDDIGSTAVGVFGNAYGTVHQSLSIIGDLATFDLKGAGKGIIGLREPLVWRYGFYSGPGWGYMHPVFGISPMGATPFSNPIEREAILHDMVYRNGINSEKRVADWAFATGLWSGQPGPVGQAYRILATGLFGARARLGEQTP